MVKEFYDYQERDINSIFETLQSGTSKKLLYQLPTGGGKTVVFSEIARRFMEQSTQTVTILTHRKELCKQTSTTLKNLGVENSVIKSSTTYFDKECSCYVAMVETLKNRIKKKKIKVNNVGLVIIDEAHHNSFSKLLTKFKNAFVIGVTATPFSATLNKPMKRHYDSLLVGESISTLIKEGFLAKPKSVQFNVELNSLKTGIHGDYTVSSSNSLYSSEPMLDLVRSAYQNHSVGKKTLIFNNGIATSRKIFDVFTASEIPIKHLDNQTSREERKETLKWFKKTKGAVLTSVSILTTGFDEPSVQTVILNRATTSITLYHQMIGRGARKLPNKKSFNIIDLGNNIERFGPWEEPVDWKFAFEHPEAFAQQLQASVSLNSGITSPVLTLELRAKFPKTLEMSFDVEGHFQEAIDLGKKHKTVIQDSIRQHTKMCLENAETVSEAFKLAEALIPEIEWRIKQYVGCLERASKSYKEWLLEDYNFRLHVMIRRLFS
ncbi:DEAD/DEAH box helicase [Flavobacterium tegetincola]|uniref:DEAD/DEAH box helicase n=1 Tax=Flavobacterium tegetincola TaxID=150172 RepID=UPI000423A80C|nr:DEAD/DEAH box helicase [Flavobacterium tegetincola]